MASSQQLLDLGTESFVSLTTFRKTGEPVSTPVWILRDGDALIVTTPVVSGKVKRLRNNPTVTVTQCNRMGKVDDSVAPVSATVQILDDPAEVARYSDLFLAKYRLEYRIFMWIERRAKSGQARRVMLRITD
ncbi:MAG: PPOX class F420-dependent oxidoreductase [Rhodoglobus sp.]